MTRPPRRHLAVATSRAYLPYASVVLRSFARHLRVGVLRAHVLHLGELGADDQERLDDLIRPWGGRARLHAVSLSSVAGMPAADRFGGGVVWLGLALPDLLPEVDRVVQVDADLLAVREPDLLWEVDLQGHPVGAVPNVVAAEEWPRLASLGIEPGSPVLNSGVLAMDLDRWRADGIVDEVRVAALRHADHLDWLDQDALNVALRDRWSPLPLHLNAQQSFWVWPLAARAALGCEEVDAAVANPTIVHFEGPLLCKPWHALCSHPWRHAFRSELASTPWAAEPLEGDTLGARAIRLLPERHWSRVHFATAAAAHRLRRRRHRVGSSAVTDPAAPVVRSFRSSHLELTVRLPGWLRRLRRPRPAPEPAPARRLELPEDRPSFRVVHEDPDRWMQRWEPSPALLAAQRELAAAPPPHTLEQRAQAVGWYHTLDLPGGLTTPGIFDHRDLVAHYGLPADLSDRRALDVATFDGFWAFELERRGAEVTAVDLPHLGELDLNAQMRAEFARRGLDRDPSAGFRLASEALGSSVRLHKSSVYDLGPDSVGTFDFVHMGDLLLHLRDPVRALERVRSVVAEGGVAHIVDSYDPDLAGRPLIRYEGGWDLGTWWTPSLDALAQMIVDVGFGDVRLHRTYRASWTSETGRWRAILVATP